LLVWPFRLYRMCLCKLFFLALSHCQHNRKIRQEPSEEGERKIANQIVNPLTTREKRKNLPLRFTQSCNFQARGNLKIQIIRCNKSDTKVRSWVCIKTKINKIKGRERERNILNGFVCLFLGSYCLKKLKEFL